MSYERKKRLKNVIDLLNQKEEMTVREISQTLNVSEMTIRRDLSALEKEGALHRTHGGATLSDSAKYSTDMYIIGEQAKKNVRVKSVIGRKAASLIKAHETIFLDSGSTTPFITKYIDRDMPLTVLCYTFTNASAFYHRKNTNLILAGGYFHRNSNVFHSLEGCDLIKKIRADKAFISTAGVDERLGLTTYFYFEADIKKTIIGSAKQIILVADSNKFGKISITYFAGLDEVHTIITDTGLAEHYRKAIRARGIELILVE